MSDLPSRRGFIRQTIGAAGSAFLIGPLLALTGCEETVFKTTPTSPDTGLTIEGNFVKLDTGNANYAILRTANGFARFVALGRNVMVFRISDTEVSALTTVCTHQGCDLFPGGSSNSAMLDSTKVQCGCHGSTFDITNGSRLAGPATSGIQKFPATVSGNTITVDLS